MYINTIANETFLDRINAIVVNTSYKIIINTI